MSATTSYFEEEGTYLYCVGVVLVLRFSAEHYHFTLAYHPTIILYTNYIRLERDIMLYDQHWLYR